MAYQSRARKRVHAFRRGPDGSAFQKCECCGVSVAIALTDMHDCESKVKVKKLKGLCQSGKVKNHNFQNQPRSAFRFFMDEFVKTCEDENGIDVDRKGFETWKKLSNEERQPFVLQAENVNSAHTKALLQEETDMSWVDDEADSAEVGKYDKYFDDDDDDYDDDPENSDSYGICGSKIFGQECIPWCW